MIKHFLDLEWKQFTRSASFGKSVALKIIMAFFALYFIAMFLILGVAMYPLLKETLPEKDPFVVFNGFIFFWILGDLVLRFFFQKLPVMSVKPLLTLPIKREKVVNFVLGKSALSFFNFLPLFAIIPFGITLIVNDYDVSSIAFWMLAMVLITLIINYLNFIIESLTAETELAFLPIIIVAGSLFALNHFEIINFADVLSNGILAIANNPLFILVPIAILAVVYYFNFKILRKKLFLDSSLKSKVQEVHASNMEWTRFFGDVAPFMQLDLKLIWRNKRPKSSLMLMVFGVLYGLFFYPNPVYQDMEFLFAFVGIFVTGIFLINFGQFIPAWDSGYYKMLMSQNIKYKQYLKSKYTLMTMSVIILFVLSIPYVYFGWKILLAHFAAAIYNIGVNTYVILLGGSFNRKKIDLNQRAAFNFQGTGAVQWIIGLPLLILPIGVFALANYFFSFEIGILVLILLGLAGIIFHQKIMTFITNKYLASKYKMIDAFDQDN
ncbi:hypothetical protein DFR65_101546 [Oceanihabitans sediminis]|uniref:Uncharacterized protein n=1 Tax=Oceanihabitans sediminis TaxID=1812012 RepID=A0A368P879_9FLAO|nr:DUF5687 family protein [Oceanihabitans sediminis]RBP34649.1 hypothetical protein DFR65_101546 [Oceanihabitans sediminis]RCU58304.1 hypothetical protein DU428_02710 [Oceanihabitans sediminis]